MCVAPWVGAVMVSGYGTGVLDGGSCARWIPGRAGLAGCRALPGLRSAPRSVAGRVVRVLGCAAGLGQALARAVPAGAASAVSVVPVIWAWSSSDGSCAGWRPAMTAPMAAAAGSSSGSELTQVRVLPVSVL